MPDAAAFKRGVPPSLGPASGCGGRAVRTAGPSEASGPGATPAGDSSPALLTMSTGQWPDHSSGSTPAER